MSYSFGETLKNLRKSRGWSQEELAKALNEKYSSTYNKGMISKWENNKEEPRMDTVRNFSDFFDITLDELLGLTKKDNAQWNNKLPELNNKDERDIQKELQRMIDGLSSNSGYAAFDGETLNLKDMDDEDRELLINSLENSLRVAKRLAKQKYTPKKYRK